jgi:hypothetical protein
VVKRARSTTAIRYDVGLVAMKRRTGRTWRDVLPLRPYSRNGDSFGPLITSDAGPVGTFDGDSMSIGANGVVEIDGGFRNWGAKSVRTARVSYQPTANGVFMRFGALPGERYQLSPFFRRTPVVSAAGEATVLDDGDQRVTISPTSSSVPPVAVTLEPGGASGADPSLTRARVSFSVAEPRDVGIEFSLAPVQAKR